MGAEALPDDRLVGGRYVLGEVLGRGGMGVVWLATDRLLDRQVAVKELTFPIGVTDEERRILRERTMREARAAGRLDHPCVTTVYDVVEQAGKPWLVMEHVDADSLQEVLERSGPLPPREVARIGLDVLAALEAAHGAGIVHRDVKPANVLVQRDGSARLTDFGIAVSTGDSSLTTQGALIGSPSYMAPERIHGDEPDPAGDLWSLGATLYAAVEARPPFGRGDPMSTAMAVVSEHPAPMVRAGALEPLLRGLLTKDVAQRTTAAQARRGLEAVLAGAEPEPAAAPAAPPAGPDGGRPDGFQPDEPVHRFDSTDLKRLAAASRAVIGTVAREARASAHTVAERRREQHAQNAVRPTAGRRRGEPRRRRRFKRRWVVVPLLIVLIIVLAVLVGLVWFAVHTFGGG
jgi:serine/threonine protein kinase